MEHNIRFAEISDVDQVVTLFMQRGKIDSKANISSRFAKVVKSDLDLFAVAEISDAVAGYIWIQNYGPHLRTGGSTARLHDIFVLPQSRRLGLARELLQYGKEWCKKNDVEYLQWQAAAEALPFYEKLGLHGDTQSDHEEYPFFEINFKKA